MKADEKSFPEFIAGDVTCVIPVYQRNYNWKTTNCQRLFDDIKTIIAKDDPHFIGTFVYKAESVDDIFQDYVIIDGQQRIASIILFARALYKFADDALQRKINAKFLRHTFSGENACRLRPTEFDREVFTKIIDGTDDFTADEKSSALYKNYDLFCKEIATSQIEPQKFFNAIYKLKVVAIRLDNENAQEIFESLNSTGLYLSQADLIRNFLLIELKRDRQEELYKNYWFKLEELLRPSDNVENFIVQYLITRRRSDAVGNNRLSKKNLYDTFKEFDKNFSDAEECLRDMLRYAKFFRQLIFNDDTKFENLSELDKKFYELTFLLKATNTPIILMHLLDRYEKNHFDEATFINFVDALISLVFRAKVCKLNGVDQQTAGNILSRLGDSWDEKSFWRAITGGKGCYTFPNNDDFQSALTDKNLRDNLKDSGLFKYFLYMLEKNSPQKLPAYSEATLEHIMPQKFNDVWKKYLDDRHDSAAEQWTNSLGNFVVVVDKKGTEIFDKKKIRYAQSLFSYTQAVSGYTYWTSNQIQARAKNYQRRLSKSGRCPKNSTPQFKARQIFSI